MILSCGEALIDMLPRQTTNGEMAFAPFAGGAVMNTAIALGRLGVRSSFFSGISNDLFGDILTKALRDSQVDTAFIAKSDRPTTLGFVTLKDGHASYAFYDENTAGRMLEHKDHPRVSKNVKAMFFGGISLPVDPCGQCYEALMLREAPHRVMMIDPNIRPSFIENETMYRARLNRMIGVADIVKLSDEDLIWLKGDGEIDSLAQSILDQGAKLVCITQGSKGATGYTSRFKTSISATKVEVVDTVGAGDTFNAGVLASLDQAMLLDKTAISNLTADQVHAALSMAAKCAAITVGRAGANPPWAHEL